MENKIKNDELYIVPWGKQHEVDGPKPWQQEYWYSGLSTESQEFKNALKIYTEEVKKSVFCPKCREEKIKLEFSEYINNG